MNVMSWLLFGLLATLVMTAMLATTQAIHLTRLSVPYLLGTFFTPNRDKAKVLGLAWHLVNGWLFALVYVLAFETLGFAAWWLGLLLGLLHAAFVLTVGMPALPGVHPRMASEAQGPTVLRQIEPPGFLALHYGSRTPASVIAAHAAFGMVLGIAYYVVA